MNSQRLPGTPLMFAPAMRSATVGMVVHATTLTMA